MTRGSSSNVPEKRRNKRQDPVSTSIESDGDHSPSVNFPRGRMGKKKVDAPIPRRKVKRTVNRQHPSGGIRIEEPRPSGSCQGNWYNSIFMGPKKLSIIEMKWIDWEFLGKQRSKVAKTAVHMCHEKNVDKLMSLEHAWSAELIGQFYATAYFEDSEDGTEEHIRSLMEGLEYTVTMSHFASILELDEHDLNKPSLHNEPALSQDVIRRLYMDDNHQVHLGTSKGLLPHFDLLLKIIKTTLSPKSGDKSTLTTRHAALLLRMCSTAQPFNVMKYIWNEIQMIVLDPSNGLSYAPFLHMMIQKIIGFHFKGECEHYAYCPKIPQAPKITGSKGKPTSSTSQLVHPSCGSSSSSSIKRALSAIFGLCKEDGTEGQVY
uniref:Uncharacterized protein n=1 Tax=Oryza brachyantha TaxID=4533 RepID=J3MVP9_ORYBR